MLTDLGIESNALRTLLAEAGGITGTLLGTTEGDLVAMAGAIADGDTEAALAASLSGELGKIGAALGIGACEVVVVKSPGRARLVARQGHAVLALEVDPRRPLGELEARLRTTAWAPTEPQEPPPLPPPPVNGTGASRSRTQGTTTPVPFAEAPTQMKAFGSGPVFTGDLQEFCLPDLLEFLRNSHRTGLLVCTSTAGTGTVQLARGMIVGADSPNALKIREYFLAREGASAEQQRALAALPAECFADAMVEGVLVSRGLVPREEVERALVERVYSAFREMMTWTVGRFAFDPGVPAMATPPLELSAQGILLQIFREQDEQRR